MAARFEALVREPFVRDRFDRAVGGTGSDATTTGRLLFSAFASILFATLGPALVGAPA